MVFFFLTFLTKSSIRPQKTLPSPLSYSLTEYLKLYLQSQRKFHNCNLLQQHPWVAYSILEETSRTIPIDQETLGLRRIFRSIHLDNSVHAALEIYPLNFMFAKCLWSVRECAREHTIIGFPERHGEHGNSQTRLRVDRAARCSGRLEPRF